MMDISGIGETKFDLSGDFNDALSVIAASDPDFISRTNNMNNNTRNYNLNDIPMSPQCLLDEPHPADESMPHPILQPTPYLPHYPSPTSSPLHVMTPISYQQFPSENMQSPQFQQPQAGYQQPEVVQAQQFQQRQAIQQMQQLQRTQPTQSQQLQQPQPVQQLQQPQRAPPTDAEIKEAQAIIRAHQIQVLHQAFNQQRIMAACQQFYGTLPTSQATAPNFDEPKSRQTKTTNDHRSMMMPPPAPEPASVPPPPQQRQVEMNVVRPMQNPRAIMKQANPEMGICAPAKQQIKETTIAVPKIKPFIEILEQPAARGCRFRYGCEVRTNGNIVGARSTPDNKTYPTIRVHGYNGDAVVIVSCVTKDEPYRAHPCNLVGKLMCKSGICKTTMAKDSMTVSFERLGIQCMKKKDIFKSLSLREKLKVDPFNNGFEDKSNPSAYDQSSVRLAFQVFIEGPTKGQFKIPLTPVVSDPIHDKKHSPDLTIYKLSHCSSPATGGQEMIILCDKIARDDIQIRFYEERDDEVVWEAYGDLTRTGAIHKHVAIVFQTPKYRVPDPQGMVSGYIELVRPSDGLCSNSVPFDFIPVNDPIGMKRKRKRLHESLMMRSFDTTSASSSSSQWNITNQLNAIQAL